MGWAAVIIAILQILGPYILKWLEEWLSHRLSEASKTLPFSVKNIPVLFDNAIDSLPRVAFARRMFLRVVKGLVTKRAAKLAEGKVIPLTPEEVRELGDASEWAAFE